MKKSLTLSQLSGEAIEYLDAPESDGVYVLRRRKGESGASIHYCVIVHSSYMPTVIGARRWAKADRKLQAANR